MRFFKQNVHYTEKAVRRLEAERDDLKAQLASASQRLAVADEALITAKAAQRPPAPNAAEIATALQRALPSVTAAPGFAQLRTAPDAPAFARGILSLLYTARSVGWREANEPRQED